MVLLTNYTINYVMTYAPKDRAYRLETRLLGSWDEVIKELSKYSTIELGFANQGLVRQWGGYINAALPEVRWYGWQSNPEQDALIICYDQNVDNYMMHKVHVVPSARF